MVVISLFRDLYICKGILYSVCSNILMAISEKRIYNSDFSRLCHWPKIEKEVSSSYCKNYVTISMTTSFSFKL